MGGVAVHCDIGNLIEILKFGISEIEFLWQGSPAVGNFGVQKVNVVITV